MTERKHRMKPLSIADKMGLFMVIVLGLLALSAYAWFTNEMAGLEQKIALWETQPAGERGALSRDWLADHATTFRRDLLFSGAAIVFLAVFLILMLVIYLLQPLATLLENVGKIQAGDLSVRCEIVHEDEIGKLARSFNEMVGNLQEKEETMLAAYESLHANYERLLAIPESSPRATLGCNEQGEIFLANGRFCDLFGRSCDDLIGASVWETFRELAPTLVAPLQAALARMEAEEKPRDQAFAAELAGMTVTVTIRWLFSEGLWVGHLITVTPGGGR